MTHAAIVLENSSSKDCEIVLYIFVSYSTFCSAAIMIYSVYAMSYDNIACYAVLQIDKAPLLLFNKNMTNLTTRMVEIENLVYYYRRNVSPSADLQNGTNGYDKIKSSGVLKKDLIERSVTFAFIKDEL